MEPGCKRFDVIKSLSKENTYIFYEVYNDQASIDFHVGQKHFEAWTSFKESGGTVSVVIEKCEGIFLP